MRTPLLAGNWKMHCTPTETAALIQELRASLGDYDQREVLVAPPFTALATAATELDGSGILLAGQDLHWEDSGAFTGEIAGPMLTAVGCSHAIIGHSERRQYFGETDGRVALKIRAALRNRLVPIVCVGETLEERESGQMTDVIERQVRGALGALDARSIGSSVLAYEPVWAIGTGRVATPDQAQEVHAAIRALLGEIADADAAASCRILYGGSVKPDNVDTLMAQPDIDGALVGGASLKAKDFARIVHFQS